MQTLFALSNLWMARRQLLPAPAGGRDHPKCTARWTVTVHSNHGMRAEWPSYAVSLIVQTSPNDMRLVNPDHPMDFAQ